MKGINMKKLIRSTFAIAISFTLLYSILVIPITKVSCPCFQGSSILGEPDIENLLE